ncbi:MAG: FAD-binding oxidoreductase [Gemmatimonadetes bacterium]|nr:FAD-binding oxidoreductase [Gemmatimonadota bacterium]
MDLHSGAPFWLVRNGLGAAHPVLSHDEHCDVAIIGAGVTGALVADALTALGQDVVLIDRRDAGLGSTCASTALLQYEIDVELAPLIARVGASAAVRAYQLGIEAIDDVERLVDTMRDRCGFARRESTYLASTRSDAKRLTSEAALRQRHGFDAEFWERDRVRDTYGFPAHGAIRSRQGAEVDALQFTTRLLERALSRGARLYARTLVVDYAARTAGVTLHTSRGHRVTAGRVVFAPGYESPPGVADELVTLTSSFALVTEPVETFGPWADRCLVWESARPYTYMRSTPDGRILIGGVDLPFRDATLRDVMLPAQTRKLAKRLHRLLPSVTAPVAFSWAGTFGQTADGLPYIGANPAFQHGLFALGYGGNGITFSVIAARIIRDLVSGTPNGDAEIFRFDR